ncbi:MAG TPA: winged helix-turn-helix domain-containing protein [Burkholderiaceae bacterium]|nr:winged helix-turn-helix domain-containing protein [Burkholderiaceae bacterium]
MDLPPKERAVLALLIRQQSKVVSKQAFADSAWRDKAMSDESLARCISSIRGVVADLPGIRIESVYGTGYRLQIDSPGEARYARLLNAAQAPPQAVEAFLHARQLSQQRTPAALDRALTLLREVSLQHPRYAAARIALAEVLGAAASWGLNADTTFVDEGLRHLDEAQRLDAASPGLATARAFLLDSAWRFDEARGAWQRAIEQASTDPETLFLHGRFLLVTGDARGAIERLRAAVRLHPYSALLRVTLARALAHAGDVPGACAEAASTCADHPESAIAGIYHLGLLAWSQPEPSLADAAWGWAERRDASPLALSVFAYALARTGRAGEALETVAACLGCPTTSPCVAALHVPTLVELGDLDRALALLAAAEQARCGVLPMALRDPGNIALRSLPAYAQLMDRVFGAGLVSSGHGSTGSPL